MYGWGRGRAGGYLSVARWRASSRRRDVHVYRPTAARPGQPVVVCNVPPTARGGGDGARRPSVDAQPFSDWTAACTVPPPKTAPDHVCRMLLLCRYYTVGGSVAFALGASLVREMASRGCGYTGSCRGGVVNARGVLPRGNLRPGWWWWKKNCCL